MNAFDTLDSLHRSILNTAFDAGNGFHISIDRNEYAIDPAYGRIIPFQLFIHYSGVGFTR